MLSPALTGSTASVFFTSRLLTIFIGVISSASSDGAVSDVPITLFVICTTVVSDGTSAETIMVVEDTGNVGPTKSKGGHVITPPSVEPSWVQPPVTPINLTSSGRVSLRTIFIASDGPLFTTSSV